MGGCFFFRVGAGKINFHRSEKSSRDYDWLSWEESFPAQSKHLCPFCDVNGDNNLEW